MESSTTQRSVTTALERNDVLERSSVEHPQAPRLELLGGRIRETRGRSRDRRGRSDARADVRGDPRFAAHFPFRLAPRLTLAREALRTNSFSISYPGGGRMVNSPSSGNTRFTISIVTSRNTSAAAGIEPGDRLVCGESTGFASSGGDGSSTKSASIAKSSRLRRSRPATTRNASGPSANERAARSHSRRTRLTPARRPCGRA